MAILRRKTYLIQPGHSVVKVQVLSRGRARRGLFMRDSENFLPLLIADFFVKTVKDFLPLHLFGLGEPKLSGAS